MLVVIDEHQHGETLALISLFSVLAVAQMMEGISKVDEIFSVISIPMEEIFHYLVIGPHRFSIFEVLDEVRNHSNINV